MLSNVQAEEIFCAALKVAPEDRQAYLDHACAGDAEIRAEVDRMLSKLPVVEQFFKNIPAAIDAFDVSEIAALLRYQEQVGLVSNSEKAGGKSWP